jgi:protein gp37
MIDISKGRYWQRPLSLVDGCTPCSPGCDHCWSAAMTHRFQGGLTFWPVKTQPYPRFCGQIITHPERLSIPLKRRKPTVYAVWNDFWHESVPDDFQYKAYDAMVEWHMFLILTKRPHIAAAYYAEGKHENLLPRENIWHGLTVCNQQEADEKIPVFLQVPGKKFLSIEPTLGAVDIVSFLPATLPELDRAVSGPRGDCLDAVILGGETGPGARPMHPDWVRSVRDQCQAASVPFFFKGWGTWKPCDDDHEECEGHKSTAMRLTGESVTNENPCWKDKAFGGQDQGFWKAGPKSGRLLDGRTHDSLPWRSV